MKTHLKTLGFGGLALFVAAGLAACGSDSDSGGGTGTLSVAVTDAPFPTGVITKAEIDVSQVDAQFAPSGGPPSSGPFVRVDDFQTPKTFDLLQLTNGVTDSLVSSQLQAGKVTHLRLYFTAARVTLSDGTTLALTVPSGAQTGLKVPLTPPADVVSGFTTDLLLDIDVSRAFVPQGDPTKTGDPGAYDDPSEITSVSFNPVARAVNTSTVGRITGTVLDGKGTVDPADDQPLGDATIRVLQSGVALTSTVAAADGTFTVLGLDPGTYTVEASKASFQASTTSASVTAGSQTAVEVVLQP